MALALHYDPACGERPEDFDSERYRALVAKGAGRPDVRAGLVDARPWDAARLSRAASDITDAS